LAAAPAAGYSSAELGITATISSELQDGPIGCRRRGSGYIAIELTGIFAALGAKATLVLRGHKP